MAEITDGALYKMMTWLSPGFPVGAFAYSHGVEYAVEAGVIHDGASLRTWIEGVLAFGAGRVDAALFRAAHEAESSRDDDRLARVVEKGEVLRGSSELALESIQQGRAFLQTINEIWPHSCLVGNCLCGNHVHQRSTLQARENRGIDCLLVRRLHQDKAAARPAQRLVGR